MNYLKIIDKIKNRKYSSYLNLKKSFMSSYLNSRNNIINNYFYSNLNKNIIKKREKKINIKNINTFDFFENLYFKYNLENKINIRDKKKIYIFYKKFEINLNLKKNYNNKFKKKNNEQTNIYTYIFLAFFLNKLKNINISQKLNCLLKLNDLVLINQDKINNKNYSKLIVQNLKIELNLLKYFIN